MFMGVLSVAYHCRPVKSEASIRSAEIWGRLFGLMRLYWWVWPIAFLIIIAEAAGAPLEAIFFNAAILSLFESEKIGVEAMYPMLDQAVLCLVLVGLGSGVAVLCQNALFTYLQECLCMILRQMAFASTIRMDMAFFDAPENQTGSILVSLERQHRVVIVIVVRARASIHGCRD
ncbi:ABC transporter B family member 3 [Symbiodinium microadriaticum]|uniref:ABC transporter B family member 3 n=1 Tax=Symbiodinium microadriaticum TaxID=2951 RepID=A0A1Q9EPG9_SYMMI|nr:ABC transporter B family member 3 [Symbiodinium microadriaticum]